MCTVDCLLFQKKQYISMYKQLCSYRIGYWYWLIFLPVYNVLSAKSHIGATLVQNGWVKSKIQIVMAVLAP